MGKNVEDLKLNEPDDMGQEIAAFYGRRSPEYAVYMTDRRVMVQFADSSKSALAQRKAMARLNPLRGEINGLVDGWRSSPADKSRAERYDRRVGDALVVAFEGDIEGAERILQEVKQDILAERIGLGRLDYLKAAFVTAAVGLSLIGIITLIGDYQGDGLKLWRAAAAGTVGAFFSISLAIRERTVLPDLQPWSNRVDAILRVIIGLIGAAVLMTMILLDVVNLALDDRDASAGATAAKGAASWLSPLLIGFIAGFSERFVGDLLSRVSAKTEARSATSTLAAPAPAPANKPEAGGAAEAAADAAQGEADDVDEALPQEAAIDGCVSDLDLPDDEATPDAALPAASGGVEPDDAAKGGQ